MMIGSFEYECFKFKVIIQGFQFITPKRASKINKINLNMRFKQRMNKKNKQIKKV